MPVVRAMPNTPAMLGAGMTALAGGRYATLQHLQLAASLFESVGRTVQVDEKHLDAVTGLSGSGPALHLHHPRSAGRGGRQGRAAARCGNAAGGADDLRCGAHGARDGRASGAAEGRGDYPGRLHGRRALELEEGGLRVTLIKAVMRRRSGRGSLRVGNVTTPPHPRGGRLSPEGISNQRIAPAILHPFRGRFRRTKRHFFNIPT